MTTVAGLLFTDLEGSTAHLRALGAEYGRVLARHHAIIRAAIEAEGGDEVGSEGDSFAAVLPTPAAATRAAVAAQHALAAEPWPDARWRVRMAVHSGAVETSAAGAVGVALHEAARLRNVAHGGQIVVSDDAAREGVDVQLIDLGIHVIRDFASPLRVHQVRVTGLDANFPPLRTDVARNVPVSLTPFIGRSVELDEIAALLRAGRVLTITGPGGSGKTRLAYEAARRAAFSWIATAELAPLTDPSQVAAAVAAAVGAPDGGAIAASVGDREMLLVIDNCEHVVNAIAPLVAHLVSTCPHATVLATSRTPFEIAAERVWRMPPMAQEDALALLTERTADDAVVTRDEPLAKVVCERLGGMPLAIELAAARLRSLSVADLAARLDDQLSVLVGGARDVPRQRTLRATLDWSHDLLSPIEQTALRRLSVFAGGFTLDAAETVLAVPTPIDTLSALDGLVQQSLLRMDHEAARFLVLEPVRQYAADHLARQGEASDVIAAHIGWVERLATNGSVGIFVDQRTWTVQLDIEMPNVGAAVGRLVDRGDVERAAQIITALSFYWATSNKGDAAVWIERLLPHSDKLSPRARGRLLLTGGMIYNDDLEDPRPTKWLEEAVDVFREVGSRRGLCSSLFWLGRARFQQDLTTHLRTLFEEAEHIAAECGDDITRGWSRLWLALLTRVDGDLDRAETMDLELLEWATLHDVPHVMGAAYGELTAIAVLREDWRAAIEQSDHAISTYRSVGDRWQLAINLCQRSLLDVMAGEISDGREHALEALQLTGVIRGSKDFGYSLIAAAIVLHAAGREDQGIALATTADRVTGIGDLVTRVVKFGAPKQTERLLRLIESPPPGSHNNMTGRDAMEVAQRWLRELHL